MQENNNNKLIFDVPIIIPSLEPDEKFLNAINGFKQAGFKNLVVINDGSDAKYDDFFDKARDEYGCDVLKHSINLGKGRALKTAFNFVLDRYKNAPCVATVDSDGQHSVADTTSCIEALLNNPEKIVLGCRNFEGQNVPLKSSFGNKLTRFVMGLLTGIKISDTQTGLRVLPKEFLKHAVAIKGERFEYETNMLIDSKKFGFELFEQPIETIYLEGNKSSHFNPLTDSFKIYVSFAKYLISSGFCTIVDFGLFNVVSNAIKLANPFSYTYILTATVIARVVSSVLNFIINRKLVFKADVGFYSSAVKYFGLVIVRMLLSAGLVSLVQFNLGGIEVVNKIIVESVLMISTYYIQQRYIFNK